MPFLSLPNEMILDIAKYLTPEIDPQKQPITVDETYVLDRETSQLELLKDISNLSKTSRQLNVILTPLLSSLMVRHKEHVLIWAAKRGYGSPLKLALDNGASASTLGEGLQALHWAAAGGHGPIIRILLVKGARINDYSLNGLTALHWAADGGHNHTVKLLLRVGADVNAGKSGGGTGGISYIKTALCCASLRGHEGVVKTLLEHDADITLGRPKNALDMAVVSRHESIVRLLLPRARPDDLASALSHAAFIGDCSMMSLLFECGVDLRGICNSYRGYPLHAAVENDHIDAVKLLLGKGFGTTLSAKQFNPHRRFNPPKTALDIAVSSRNDTIVKLLLESRASIGLSCEEMPDIARCLREASKQGNHSIVAALLKTGVDIGLKDDRLWNALHYAADGAHKSIVALLLENGADINAETSRGGETALSLAARRSSKDTVQILLEKGAHVDALHNGCTMPLHNAIRMGGKHPVELLLKYGANVNSCAFDGRPVFHWALDNSEILGMLLDSPGIDINSVDSYGGTALHGLFVGQSTPCLIEANTLLLIERGIDVDIINNAGHTALDKAMFLGLDLIIPYLVKASKVGYIRKSTVLEARG